MAVVGARAATAERINRAAAEAQAATAEQAIKGLRLKRNVPRRGTMIVIGAQTATAERAIKGLRLKRNVPRPGNDDRD